MIKKMVWDNVDWDGLQRAWDNVKWDYNWDIDLDFDWDLDLFCK